jgi:type I restriction enzyme, S subunit
MKQAQINKLEWKEIPFGDKDYFEIVGSGINEFTGKKDYLSTESIKGTKIEKIECSITYEDKPSRANMQPVINSVWFAKMQSTLKVYAFTKNNEKEINQYILSTGFAGIKILNENISPEYIRIYLTTDRFNLEKDKLCTGSTQRGINNSFIIKIKIPIPFLPDGTPDLKEQEKIASILGDIKEIKDKGEKVEGLLDEFLESIFYERFLKKNKKSSLIKLGSVCTKITDGVHSKPDYTKAGIPFISVVNVNKRRLKFNNCKYISEKAHQSYYKRCNPEKGDILYTKVGATYGIASLVDTTKPFSLYVSVALIKPDNKKIDSLFLKFIMNSTMIKRQADKRIKGIGVPDLHLIEIKSFLIPLPPLPLQQKFARIVKQVEEMKESLNKMNQNAEELFNSLMSKAFKGEL